MQASSISQDYEQAISNFNEAIRLDPSSAEALHSRARLFAICPDDKYRNGLRAVEDATKACKLTHWKHPRTLSTLAAAYAEVGDFEKAAEWQSKAHDLYSVSDKEKWGYLLDLYRSGEPFRHEPIK